MAWDDTAPTKEDLAWDDMPPDETEIKEGENPYIKAAKESYVPETSAPEAFARQAAQSVMLNFEDEAEAAYDTVKELVQNGLPLDNAIDYYYGQKEKIKMEEQAGLQKHPIASVAGAITGGALLPMPGGAAFRAASGLKKIAAGAKSGATLGAGYGLGEAESIGDIKGTVESTVAGAGTGGLFGGGATLVGNVAGKRLFEDNAAKAAEKAMTKVNKIVYNNAGVSPKTAKTLMLKTDETGSLTRKFTPNKVGAWIEKEGVDQWASNEKRFEHLNKVINKYGNEKTVLLKQLDDLHMASKPAPIAYKGGVNSPYHDTIKDYILTNKKTISSLVQDIKNNFKPTDIMEKERFQMAYDNLIEKISTLPKATLSPSEIDDVISSVGKIIPWERLDKKKSPLLDVWKKLKDIQKTQANRLDPTEKASESISKLNTDLNLGLELKKGFEKKAAKEMASQEEELMGGLSAPSAGASAFRGARGAGFIAATTGIDKLAKNLSKVKYGWSKSRADMFTKISKKRAAMSPIAKKALDESAKRGVNSVVATHFLLQQSDPTYRQLMEEKE